MDAINLGMIKISGAVNIKKIHSIMIHEKINEQADADICGSVIKEEMIEIQKKNIIDESLVIEYVSEGQNYTVFVGVVKAMAINEFDNQISIKCKGMEDLTNRDKKSCSYQNVKLTVKDIMKNTLHESGILKYHIKKDIMLQRPVIRYRESEWEFIRRLTSNVGSVIYPISISRKPMIVIGLPEEGEPVSLTQALKVIRKVSRLNNAPYKHGNPSRPFISLEVTTYQKLLLGEKVLYSGEAWFVVEKRAELLHSILVFHYVLGKSNTCNLCRYGAMAGGSSISGKIIDVRDEKVKLHLSIDKIQEKEDAYYFPYKPETGNIMYAMPELGETAQLYFRDEYEENGFVTHGRNKISTLQNEHKFLKSPYKKSLNLYPYGIVVTADKKNGSGAASIKLKDGFGITLSSDKKIKIVAGGKVKISCRQSAKLAADSYICLKQKNAINEMRLCGNGIISHAEKYRMIPLKRLKKTRTAKTQSNAVFHSVENNLKLLGAISSGNCSDIQQYVMGALPVCTYPENPQVEGDIGLYIERRR